jgi:hypothetical protein
MTAYMHSRIVVDLKVKPRNPVSPVIPANTPFHPG